jgi:hypothetical protein
MNTKIQGKYTTIDATTIVEIMRNNKDLLFELDLRTLDREAATKTANAIKEVFGTDTSITDRLLVQVGSPEMYEAIDDVYHFKYYQYIINILSINQRRRKLTLIRLSSIAKIMV